MPDVRTLLRPVAVALLLAAGGLLLWPAPPAHACLPGGGAVDVPLSLVTEEQRRWVVKVGPDYLSVWPADALPAKAVAFEGTPLSTIRDPRSPGWQGEGPQEWTFRVERVLRGDVPPEVVVVGADGDACPRWGPTYELGVRQWVVAGRRDEDPHSGTLRGWIGRYTALAPGHATGGAPRTIDVDALPPEPPRRPVQRWPEPRWPELKWPDVPSGATFGTWVVLVFLAEMAILGLATLAGGVYLRARELDLAERELALREREAGRRS